MSKAQTELIKKHLNDGGSLTSIDALNMFGSLRLAARIKDLRESGMNIITAMENSNGKRYARYFKAVQ